MFVVQGFRRKLIGAVSKLDVTHERKLVLLVMRSQSKIEHNLHARIASVNPSISMIYCIILAAQGALGFRIAKERRTPNLETSNSEPMQE